MKAEKKITGDSRWLRHQIERFQIARAAQPGSCTPMSCDRATLAFATLIHLDGPHIARGVGAIVVVTDRVRLLAAAPCANEYLDIQFNDQVWLNQLEP